MKESPPPANSLDLNEIDFDNPEHLRAFYNALNGGGRKEVGESLRRAVKQKFMDEWGDPIPSFTPSDRVASGIPQIRFFRHGESTGNAGEATTDPATIPLTERGREQAAHIAKVHWKKPTLIVVSPYERTRETAAPLLAQFPDTAVEVWPVQEFTYLAPASCAGTTGAERRPRVERYWSSGGPDERDGPGAESFSDLLRRADDARVRLEALPAGSQAAVFTHGQFLQALRLLVHFPSLEDWAMKHSFRALDRKYPIENGACIEGIVLRGRLCLLERLW
ncbi:MAG: histidine phosphatase family protein [Bryobacterales bacterium]|nr:histidine phosphatase family protein [Bryobacterales bacterium]